MNKYSSNPYIAKQSFPHINLNNLTSSGNLSSESHKSIYQRNVDSKLFQGVSFVIFYSWECCNEYLDMFTQIHNQLLSLKSLQPVSYTHLTLPTKRIV